MDEASSLKVCLGLSTSMQQHGELLPFVSSDGFLFLPSSCLLSFIFFFLLSFLSFSFLFFYLFFSFPYLLFFSSWRIFLNGPDSWKRKTLVVLMTLQNSSKRMAYGSLRTPRGQVDGLKTLNIHMNEK